MDLDAAHVETARAKATEDALGKAVGAGARAERHLERERAPLAAHTNGRPGEVAVELDAGDAATSIATPADTPDQLLDERELHRRTGWDRTPARVRTKTVDDERALWAWRRGKG